MSTYANRLHATKEHFPFDLWQENGEAMEQYSEENCSQFARIFDRLIEQLISLGEKASEQEKLEAFRVAIQATNELDAENFNMLIETGERDELIDLCNHIAVAAGLDPGKYGDGEGPASMWRDW